MPIVNGKIVRDKPKKKKGVIEEQKEKATKRLRDKALGKEEKKKKPNKIQEGFEKFKKEQGIEKPKKKKSKSKDEDFIRTGDNSGLRIELSEYNGKDVVAVRKLYCTKADPEMKVGSGGFNLPTDKKVLKALISSLQEVCDSL